MATVEAKNVVKGITVKDGLGNPITLPRNAQEIIKSEVSFETMLKSFIRVGGRGKLQRDGKIYYDFYAKADADREISATIDPATGLETAGMYGVQTAGATGTYGYVEPTTIKIGEDFVSLVGGKFFKEIITNVELQTENMPTLATSRIETYREGFEETRLNAIKIALASSIGKIGNAAKDLGFTITTARKEAKTYAVDEAGGIQAYNDIDKSLKASLRIGRKGTVEEAYPFARGSVSSRAIILSEEVNRALTIAFKESPSGTFPGLAVNNSTANVLTLFGVPVFVFDMPASGGKEFNWMVAANGKSGAIAMPSIFNDQFTIRPHFEGVSTLAKIIEGSGGSFGIKFLQPELNFGSFQA